MITLAPRLTLERFHMSDFATIGKLFARELREERICYTLELTKWGHPCCIPKGIYPVRGGKSPRLEKLGKKGKAAWVWWIDKVPGREDVQIHTANRPSELRGCIAPGLSVNGTYDEISDSRLAFSRILKIVGGWLKAWELEITEI